MVAPSDDDLPATDEELLRYVERFALSLRGMGMPPMAARVFAYALAEDSDHYTAGELAAALRASPAAISGAVRYLVQVGFLSREREPGTRSDLYVLRDDVWVRMIGTRLETLDALMQLIHQGVEVVGAETPGGRRLTYTAEYFAFVRAGTQRLHAEWAEIEAGRR